MRVQRTPVIRNFKCLSCMHYDGNAQAPEGACNVGNQPYLCGTGELPEYGFLSVTTASSTSKSPLNLADTTADADATAQRPNPPITQVLVSLGDDHLNLAKHILMDMQARNPSAVCRVHASLQPGPVGVNVHASGGFVCNCGAISNNEVAEAMIPYLKPREKAVIDQKAIVMHLNEAGFNVDNG